MAKLVYSFGPADLVECPERWEHYKELWFTETSLYLFESERKDPGKRFFYYSSLHSSIIKSLWTTQETINSPVYVNIETKHNFYKFRLRPREEN